MVEVYTCPRCGLEVDDVPENRTWTDSLIMCPKCRYYFDRVWEIFNHIKMEYPTIDHISFNNKRKSIIIQPYSCDSEVLMELLVCAKKLKYIVTIRGHAEHHPDCLTIELRRPDIDQKHKHTRRKPHS